MTVTFRMQYDFYSTVTCRVRDTGYDVEFSTGIELHPQWWDKSINRCSPKVPASGPVNRKLEDIEMKIYECFTIYSTRDGRRPTGKELKEYIFGPGTAKVTLQEYAIGYIAQLASRTNHRTGVEIRKATVAKQEAVLDKLRHYDDSQKQPVTLQSAGMGFYQGFVDMMVQAGYSLNTIGKHMSIIRSWLRQADADGLDVDPAHRSTRWYIGRERTSHISLSLEELQRMADMPMTGTRESARDLFLISAFTGLRHSDAKRLDRAVIHNGLLEIEQQKTLDKVVIPVHPVVAGILDKYRQRGITVPVGMSNAKMNQVIKDIARDAGICDDVVKRITRGGKRVEERLQRWQMVTTHTARRSFAKNLYLTGFKLEYLSRVMGHRSLEQTMEYIGLDSIEKAQLLKKHWDQTDSDKDNL